MAGRGHRGGAPDGPPPRVAPRRIAAAVWAAMLTLPLLLLGVVLAVEREPSPAAPRDLLLGLAVATSALGVFLSRTLPQRISSRQAGGPPAANAFTRLLVAWALCEGVAIFPLLAHILVHDHRLLAVYAVDLAALALLYPSADAWAHLAADRVEAGPGRTVR